MGVINEPPPTPVTPTQKPTTTPANIYSMEPNITNATYQKSRISYGFFIYVVVLIIDLLIQKKAKARRF